MKLFISFKHNWEMIEAKRFSKNFNGILKIFHATRKHLVKLLLRLHDFQRKM